MSFDESVLDDADVLGRRDGGGLLWALATAGAQVRRAQAMVSDVGWDRLSGLEIPRAVLVCTDATSVGAARVLVRLVSPVAPALMWHGVELPRWAGPADALLVGSTDGRHPRLLRMVEQAAHRGLALAVVAPGGSPAAEAAGRAPVADLPPSVHLHASRWSVLTPLVQAAHEMGLLSTPPNGLSALADALDETAGICRPSSGAFTNPAKMLAIELDSAIPVVAGAGPVAGVAAAVIGETLQVLAGVPAVSVALPDGMALAGAMLRGGPPDRLDDELAGLFADRETGRSVLRPRLITVGDDGDPEDPAWGPRSDAQVQLDEVAARRAAAALRGIATQRGLRSSAVDVPETTPLGRFAAATAFGDFTAAYLALGRGIDPSEPRPGEPVT